MKRNKIGLISSWWHENILVQYKAETDSKTNGRLYFFSVKYFKINNIYFHVMGLITTSNISLIILQLRYWCLDKVIFWKLLERKWLTLFTHCDGSGEPRSELFLVQKISGMIQRTNVAGILGSLAATVKLIEI